MSDPEVHMKGRLVRIKEELHTKIEKGIASSNDLAQYESVCKQLKVYRAREDEERGNDA